MSIFRSFAVFSFVATVSSVAAQTAPALAREEPVPLEQLIITGSALAQTQADLAQSTAALEGRTLALRQQSSLGETLAAETGVAATYFGPGASRPVIRGIGGDRVRILENGLGSFDVSNVSPDHAVSTEPLFVERLELVRGPAALLYGNAAIGGVVNTVDGRIPDTRATRPLEGEAAGRFGSMADERAAAVKLRGGADDLAWQARVSRRSTGDTRIPGNNFAVASPDDAGLTRGSIPNTALTSDCWSLGTTWFGHAVRVGAAVTGYDTNYGIPPAPTGTEEASSSATPELVRIGLRQRRGDATIALTEPLGPFQSAKVDLGVADYRHAEIEDGQTGTEFRQKSREARLALSHQPLGQLTGTWGAQYQFGDLAVTGDEAFLPPVRTTSLAAFASEELAVGPVIFQGGARVERQRVAPASTAGKTAASFAPASFSFGAVWTWNMQWGIAVSATRSDRAPNATELFAEGPHAGTKAYEVGDATLGLERAHALEVSLRRRAGFVTGAATFFRSHFANYLFEQRTAAVVDDLPVYRFTARAATFAGYEIETWWHLHESAGRGLELKLATDAVRATERTSGAPLPRIPARRVLSALQYTHEAFAVGVDVTRTFAQTRTAPGEDGSRGYTLLGADVSWKFAEGRTTWLLFLRGTNLTNEEARSHVSFLKDIAPLPGRGITAGLQTKF